MTILDRLLRGLSRLAHGAEAWIGLHPPDDESDVAEESVAAPAGEKAVEARAGSAEHAEAIRALAGDLSKFWQEQVGEPIRPQELELLLALSGLETVWGLGWRDKTGVSADGKIVESRDMRGSHNFNARQFSGPGAAWTRVEYGDTRPPTEAEVAAGQVANVSIDAPFNFYVDAEGRTAAENGAYYFVKDLTKTWNAREALRAGSAPALAHRLGPDKAAGGLGYFGGFGTTMAQREGGYANALASRLPEVVAALGRERSAATVAPATGAYANTATGKAQDPRLGGFGDDVGAWLHGGLEDLARWLGFRSLKDASDVGREDQAGVAPYARSTDASLSDRRRAALAAMDEVIPSAYGDTRFTRLAPGYRVETFSDGSPVALYDGAVRLGDSFSTCGYVPGYVGARLGLAKNLSSYGTEGLRTNAREWGAWVEPGGDRRPRPGDAYALEGPGGGIVHVGMIRHAPPSGDWETGDAGQGGRGAGQRAEYVARPYDPEALTLGGPLGPRRLAGWVDIDRVPLAAGAHPLAALVAPREEAA